MSIDKSIEIRPATAEELTDAEYMRASVFAQASLTAIKHTSAQQQVKVRLKIRELVGEPPGYTLIAWDGDKAVGIVSIDTKEYSNPVPGLAGLWALRHLGLLGMLKYLALSLTGYRATQPDEAYFVGGAVLPDYRKMNIATLLTLETMKVATEIGKTKATAYIANENAVSQKLAMKCGFRRAERPRAWWRRLLFGKPKFTYFEKSLLPQSEEEGQGSN